MTRPELDPVRAARAWLSEVVEPGDPEVHRMLAAYGPVDTRRRLLAGDGPAHVVEQVAARCQVDHRADDLAAAARLGVRLVTPEDPDWPADTLHAMDTADPTGCEPGTAPPQALWVRGVRPLVESLTRAVAVVGSRDATPYGARVAADLGYQLAQRGWTVVAGGAFGIDAAAHRGALAADGCTIALLPGGLHEPCPSGHGHLFQRVAETGLLISEWPPTSRPQRRRFLRRNRVLAALPAGVGVVEAGLRSGTLGTARHASRLGRAVMAVPGPITSSQSAGCHLLLQARQTCLVTDVDDILAAITAAATPDPALRGQP